MPRSNAIIDPARSATAADPATGRVRTTRGGNQTISIGTTEAFGAVSYGPDRDPGTAEREREGA